MAKSPTALASNGEHAASWNRAVDAANNTVRGPHNPNARAAAGHERDPLDVLPKDAREKFRALADKHDELRAVSRIVSEKLNAAITENVERQRKFDEYLAIPRHMPPDPAKMKAEQDAVEKTKQEVERAQEKHDARAHRNDMTGQLYANVARWIKTNSGLGVTAHKTSSPKVKNGETLLAAVKRCRQTLLELEADKHEVESAPITSQAVHTMVATQVEQLAQAGQPNVYSLYEGAAGVSWPKHTHRISVENVTPSLSKNGDVFTEFFGKGIAFNETTDTLALFCWLHRDALLSKLQTEAEAYADDEHALDDKQRTAKLAKIASDTLAVERAEESYIELSEEQGAPIERRPDMDPRAFLGVTGAPLQDW